MTKAVTVSPMDRAIAILCLWGGASIAFDGGFEAGFGAGEDGGGQALGSLGGTGHGGLCQDDKVGVGTGALEFGGDFLLVGFGVAALEGLPRIGAEQLDQVDGGTLCVGRSLEDVHGGAERALERGGDNDFLSARDGFLGHRRIDAEDGAIGQGAGDFGTRADGRAGAQDGSCSAVAGVQDGVGDSPVQAGADAACSGFGDEAVVHDVLHWNVGSYLVEEFAERSDVSGGSVNEGKRVHSGEKVGVRGGWVKTVGLEGKIGQLTKAAS